ncbi:MAG: bifunctional folylpolyglutamate synthase/dihydrofolate synthase [Ignavibacteriae bacterium]|nr:bifunctional folylpolyglutamate synthase/dihydrofolate synthase [Ignavibacteriota bacterium]
MNIDLALEKIFSLKQFHVKLGLEKTIHLLNHIGNPQNEFKSIHVAGSNGKGSTCSFIASILQEHGFKVGLYTSPHFVRFNERIRINGNEISDSEILKFLNANKKFIDKEQPTFFEITTALAFQYFAKQKVDFAVIETGLGGRLDSTNVINPLISIITSISLEHTNILGNSYSKIAFEKAGIIKNRIPIVIGKIPKSAKNVISKIANEKKSILIDIQDEIKVYKNHFTLKTKNEFIKFEIKNLSGTHQYYNAGLAIKSLEKIIPKLEFKEIQIGLDNVIINSGLQCRYERFSENPQVIFDSAHNLEGVKSFVKQFKKEFLSFKNRKLIYGALNDKDNEKMLSQLKPYFDKVFITEVNNERGEKANVLSVIAKSLNMDVSISKYPEKIIAKFFNSRNNSDNCLVVLGSMYLLGEIKLKLLKK